MSDYRLSLTLPLPSSPLLVLPLVLHISVPVVLPLFFVKTVALHNTRRRDLSYVQGLSGPAVRRWAGTLAATVREIVLWRARRDCTTVRSSARQRAAAEAAEAHAAASTGAIQVSRFSEKKKVVLHTSQVFPLKLIARCRIVTVNLVWRSVGPLHRTCFAWFQRSNAFCTWLVDRSSDCLSWI